MTLTIIAYLLEHAITGFTMSFLSTHLAQMIDLDASTYVFLGSICTIAVWLMRNSLANIMTVILVYPLVLLLSLLANHIFMATGVFDPKKMADWLIGTISAATIGLMLGLAIIAVTARMWERQPV
jgi:fucose 4-O-acetylase-like acetyltransferase